MGKCGLSKSEPQGPSHTFSDPLLEVGSSIPPHLGCFDIGRAFVVGLSEHGHDGYKNLFNTLNGRPPLRGAFVMVRVIARWVEDGYAYFAIGVDWNKMSCQ